MQTLLSCGEDGISVSNRIVKFETYLISIIKKWD